MAIRADVIKEYFCARGPKDVTSVYEADFMQVRVLPCAPNCSRSSAEERPGPNGEVRRFESFRLRH